MSRFVSRSSLSRLLFRTSSPPVTHFARLENIQVRADPRCGSQGNGSTCDFDPLNSCCSQYGYCGNSSEFCQVSQGCQSGCISTSAPMDGRCGTGYGGTTCQNGCCGMNGYCGTTDEHCLISNGCQSGCTSTNSSTGIATDTWEFPSRAAKIGLITGGSVFVVSVILISLFLIWRCKRRKGKAFDLATDSEPDLSSLPDPLPAVTEIITPSLNRLCIGCSQTKSILAAFPLRRITAGCSHEPGFCRQCLEMKINVSLTQDGWEQAICPESGCNSRLEEADIREFAGSDDIQRYLARQRRTESRECQICVTDRIVATEYPNRPATDRCLHLPACKECIASTIRAAIDEGRWTNIECPLCPNQLEFIDIAEFAAKEDFARYDRLSTRRAMEQIPYFRWCLRDGCDYGQIHAPGEQLMLCGACGYEMCYVHQRPWHTGLTCQEFDAQNARRLRLEEAAVKAVIQRTTKPCPKCKVNVEKVEGTCNHMTCRPPVGCGQEFCHECLVNWTGYGRRTKHKQTCGSYIAS